MAVPEQETVEPRRVGGSSDLQHLSGLHVRLERPHRPLDEATGRQGGQYLFEPLVGVRPGWIQKAQRGAEFHGVLLRHAGASRYCAHCPTGSITPA